MTTAERLGKYDAYPTYNDYIHAWYEAQAAKAAKPKPVNLGRYIPGTLIVTQATKGPYFIPASEWKVEYVEQLERAEYVTRGTRHSSKSARDLAQTGRIVEGIALSLPSVYHPTVRVTREFARGGTPVTSRRYNSLAAAAITECRIAREIHKWTNDRKVADAMHRKHGCPFGADLDPSTKCLCGTPEYSIYWMLDSITEPIR